MNQEVTPWRTTYTKKYAMANSHTYTFFRQLSTSSFSRPGLSSALPADVSASL